MQPLGNPRHWFGNTLIGTNFNNKMTEKDFYYSHTICDAMCKIQMIANRICAFCPAAASIMGERGHAKRSKAAGSRYPKIPEKVASDSRTAGGKGGFESGLRRSDRTRI